MSKRIKKKIPREIPKDKETTIKKQINLNVAEYEMLRELAAKVNSGNAVLEIADTLYESTQALAKGARPNDTKVFNIALYGRNQFCKNSDALFENHTKNVGITNGIISLDGRAYDLSRYWKITIGLLAVMGYQQYEDVRKAVICWQEKLSSDGVVVIYNCQEAGPAKAIKELTTDFGNLLTLQIIDNLTTLGRDRCQHHWIINPDETGVCQLCGRRRNFKRLYKEAFSLGIGRRIITRTR